MNVEGIRSVAPQSDPIVSRLYNTDPNRSVESTALNTGRLESITALRSSQYLQLSVLTDLPFQFFRNIRTHASSKGKAEHNQQTLINSSVHENKRFEKTPENKSVSESCLPIRIRGESTEDKKERKTASKNLKKVSFARKLGI
ncbi:hypothetical protein QAD02_013248 [Eretmocerus hayati]|uniref:Uncharacterized protein n=1 Tax=Eretmocerus hayati TaxID=131215 RepID=A0ACC2P327_9HYME|nr:hypothetical protein QAD02_013248 [Eretmocerus hayati]